MKRLAALLVPVLSLAACGGAPSPPPSPPPADVVGTFDCTFVVNGEEIPGVLEIREEDGAYSGTVSSDMGSMPVEGMSVDGPSVAFTVEAPDMTIPFDVTFEGDGFRGTFDLDGMGRGRVTGTRRR